MFVGLYFDCKGLDVKIGHFYEYAIFLHEHFFSINIFFIEFLLTLEPIQDQLFLYLE